MLRTKAFVTRLNKNDIESDGVIAIEKVRGEFSLSTPKEKSDSGRILGQKLSWDSLMGDDRKIKRSMSSESSASGEVVRFDVFERHGFDRIMETVANPSGDQQLIAKCVCDTLDLVASLSSE